MPCGFDGDRQHLRLRLITYNIHRAIGLDRRFRLDRIVQILADHNVDIVLLQEVDEGAPRTRKMNLAETLARELGFPYYAVGHNVSLRKGRYGNATLSRFPIARERNIDLTVEERKRRGCQHTTINLESQRAAASSVEVFNLHLGLNSRERQRQAGLLARSEEIMALGNGTPCVLGGDFNDWRSLLRAFFVEGMGFSCASDRDTDAGPRAIPTYPSFSPRAGLDRIYYRGKLKLVSVSRCRHQTARIASDHLPVIGTFEV